MKKNKISVVFNYKCPQCHEGDMFVKPFKFNNPLNMNKSCDQCGLDFEQEPGFYYGAMFISYMITVFLMLVLAGTLLLGLKLSENLSLGLILLFAMLLFFKILRSARAIWLGMTIKYDINALANYKRG